MDILKELFGTSDELQISKSLFGAPSTSVELGLDHPLPSPSHDHLTSRPLPLLLEPRPQNVPPASVLVRRHSMDDLHVAAGNEGDSSLTSFRSDSLRAQSVFPQLSETTPPSSHVDLHNVPHEMPMYLLEEDEGNDEEIMRLLETPADSGSCSSHSGSGGRAAVGEEGAGSPLTSCSSHSGSCSGGRAAVGEEGAGSPLTSCSSHSGSCSGGRAAVGEEGAGSPLTSCSSHSGSGGRAAVGEEGAGSPLTSCSSHSGSGGRAAVGEEGAGSPLTSCSSHSGSCSGGRAAVGEEGAGSPLTSCSSVSHNEGTLSDKVPGLASSAEPTDGSAARGERGLSKLAEWQLQFSDVCAQSVSDRQGGVASGVSISMDAAAIETVAMEIIAMDTEEVDDEAVLMETAAGSLDLSPMLEAMEGRDAASLTSLGLRLPDCTPSSLSDVSVSPTAKPASGRCSLSPSVEVASTASGSPGSHCVTNASIPIPFPLPTPLTMSPSLPTPSISVDVSAPSPNLCTTPPPPPPSSLSTAVGRQLLPPPVVGNGLAESSVPCQRPTPVASPCSIPSLSSLSVEGLGSCLPCPAPSLTTACSVQSALPVASPDPIVASPDLAESPASSSSLLTLLSRQPALATSASNVIHPTSTSPSSFHSNLPPSQPFPVSSIVPLSYSNRVSLFPSLPSSQPSPTAASVGVPLPSTAASDSLPNSSSRSQTTLSSAATASEPYHCSRLSTATTAAVSSASCVHVRTERGHSLPAQLTTQSGHSPFRHTSSAASLVANTPSPVSLQNGAPPSLAVRTSPPGLPSPTQTPVLNSSLLLSPHPLPTSMRQNIERLKEQVMLQGQRLEQALKSIIPLQQPQTPNNTSSHTHTPVVTTNAQASCTSVATSHASPQTSSSFGTVCNTLQVPNPSLSPSPSLTVSTRSISTSAAASSNSYTSASSSAPTSVTASYPSIQNTGFQNWNFDKSAIQGSRQFPTMHVLPTVSQNENLLDHSQVFISISSKSSEDTAPQSRSSPASSVCSEYDSSAVMTEASSLRQYSPVTMCSVATQASTSAHCIVQVDQQQPSASLPSENAGTLEQTGHEREGEEDKMCSALGSPVRGRDVPVTMSEAAGSNPGDNEDGIIPSPGSTPHRQEKAEALRDSQASSDAGNNYNVEGTHTQAESHDQKDNEEMDTGEGKVLAIDNASSPVLRGSEIHATQLAHENGNSASSQEDTLDIDIVMTTEPQASEEPSQTTSQPVSPAPSPQSFTSNALTDIDRSPESAAPTINSNQQPPPNMTAISVPATPACTSATEDSPEFETARDLPLPVCLPTTFSVCVPSAMGWRTQPFGRVFGMKALPVRILPPLGSSEEPPITEAAKTPPPQRKKRKRNGGGWPKGKKRKTKKDSSPPKPPATAYGLFLSDKRQSVGGDTSFQTISKKIGKMWSQLSSDEKQKYTERAAGDKQRYLEELKAYLKDRQKENAADSLERVSCQLSQCVESAEDNEVLMCQLCQLTFTTLHNKQCHYSGKMHTDRIWKELNRLVGDTQQQKQQQQQQQQISRNTSSSGKKRSVSSSTEHDDRLQEKDTRVSESSSRDLAELHGTEESKVEVRMEQSSSADTCRPPSEETTDTVMSDQLNGTQHEELTTHQLTSDQLTSNEGRTQDSPSQSTTSECADHISSIATQQATNEMPHHLQNNSGQIEHGSDLVSGISEGCESQESSTDTAQLHTASLNVSCIPLSADHSGPASESSSRLASESSVDDVTGIPDEGCVDSTSDSCDCVSISNELTNQNPGQDTITGTSEEVSNESAQSVDGPAQIDDGPLQAVCGPVQSVDGPAQNIDTGNSSHRNIEDSRDQTGDCSDHVDSDLNSNETRNPSNSPDPGNQSLPDITSCDDTSGGSPSLIGPHSVPHGDCVTASLMQWAQGYAGILSELEQQTSVYHSTLEQYATLHEAQEGEVEMVETGQTGVLNELRAEEQALQEHISRLLNCLNKLTSHSLP